MNEMKPFDWYETINVCVWFRCIFVWHNLQASIDFYVSKQSVYTYIHSVAKTHWK